VLISKTDGSLSNVEVLFVECILGFFEDDLVSVGTIDGDGEGFLVESILGFFEDDLASVGTIDGDGEGFFC